MAQPHTLDTPSIPAPSEVVRFLQVRGYQNSAFPSTKFASYLGLTAAETQAILNHYVEEGLLTFAGIENDVETWLPSRDGTHAFGINRLAKRLTKKIINDVQAALRAIADELTNFGVQELSLGGRPAFGKLGGPLLVGVRISHEPYTRSGDIQILVLVHQALQSVQAGHQFSAFLFETSVPERLKKRLLLTGPEQGQVAVTEESLLDIEERAHYEALERFLIACGACESFAELRARAWALPSLRGIPRSLSYYIEREVATLAAPVRCQPSHVAFAQNTADVLAAYSNHFDFRYEADNRRDRNDWEGRKDNYMNCFSDIMAEVDYFASLGKLEEGCKRVDEYALRGMSRWSVSDAEEFQAGLLGQLQAYWEELAKGRVSKREQQVNRPPSDIRHYAAFDCLSGKGPHLVGFVRQPTSNRAGFNDLEDFWGIALARLEGSAGQLLYNAQFNVGHLSLFYRPATEEEIAAYEEVSKKAGRTFKYIIVGKDSGQASPVRGRYETIEIANLPESLTSSKLEGPLLPKLLRGAAWRTYGSVYLFDAIETFPKRIAQTLRERLINTEDVQMAEFARRASQTPCTDPVVLSSQLHNNWTFSAQGRGAWRASIGEADWEVCLEQVGKTLNIEVEIDGDHYREQLAPYSGRYGARYTGQFSSLYSFMRNLSYVRDFGLAAYYERAETEGRPYATDPGTRLERLVELVNERLHGYPLDFGRIEFGHDYDATSWPSLQVEQARSKTERDEVVEDA